MSQPIRDLMTRRVVKLPGNATIVDAARSLRDSDVGSIVVEEDGKLRGLVTDRDIAIRAVAEERDPRTTRLSEICSKDLVTLSADDETDRAVEIMRKRSVRRIPIVDHGKVVGILSLGDLAAERDSNSVLGQISSAAPNH